MCQRHRTKKFLRGDTLLVYVPASASGEAYTIALRGANEKEGLAIIEIFEGSD